MVQTTLTDREIEGIFQKRDTPKDNWVLACKKVMPKKVFLVTGMTVRGSLTIRQVRDEVKVNSDFYIKRVFIQQELVPMFENDKVFVHHDKAPSYISRKMAAFAKNMHDTYGITFIKKKDIPINEANISSMDFHSFSFLKQEIDKTIVKTFQGMCKNLAKIWFDISVKQCQDTYRSWKHRLLQVKLQNGGCIEHIRDIH